MTNKSRCQFLGQAGTLGAAALVGTGSVLALPRSPARAAASSGPLKIGLLEDRTGDLVLYGLPKTHAVQLAIDEINKYGPQHDLGEKFSSKGQPGLLGRQLQLINPDPQSTPALYQQLARQLIAGDNVDVFMGCVTSASREAIRPIVDQYKKLFFYNEQYEGGVCDSYTYCTGAVPEQQITTGIPFMMQKYGPKFYTIAADYNFGQITAKWVRLTAAEHGGKILGEEFIPLSVGQFSSTISNIQKAKPDFLVALLVGTTQDAYFEQAQAAGLKVPMFSSVLMDQAYEHKRFKAPALGGMHVATNYMEEIPTAGSKAFVKRFRTMFPKEPYIGEETEAAYVGMHLYALAVQKAKSADQAAVITALQTGLSIEGPVGRVAIDPGDHHASMTIFMAVADEQQKITFPKTWNNVKPYWLDQHGCDLRKTPNEAQYEPGKTLNDAIKAS